MKHLLPKLTSRLQPFTREASSISVPKFSIHLPSEDNETISHTWLWPRVGQFFRSKDVVVAETGTSARRGRGFSGSPRVRGSG